MPINFKSNNLPIETLTAIAEQLQGAVESILNKKASDGLTANITSQSKRLLCRAQEWRSEAFFVIVVGPVKSGKSTFVNLLAHEKVSPTHFLECTVRPSIISRKADANGDSLITPFLTEGEPSIDHIDTIIDYIKGLEYADLNNVRTEESCVLNDKNLDMKVSYRTGLDLREKEKIALTAITTKGGEFLQDKIYLIDMPGFDGVMANLNASFYEAIVNRADLVVFVQSSNSAINKISEDFCTLIQKRNGLVPIFFIHNYFDSAYWQTEEARKRVTDGHIEKAKNFFDEQKLALNQENCYCINLGKVTDARNIEDNTCIIPEYDDMLKQEDERFRAIEQALHQKISSSQNKMRLQNCINRTIREAELLGELLRKRQVELALLKQQYDKLNSLFDKLIADMSPISVTSILDMTEKRPGLISQLQTLREGSSINIGRTDKFKTEIVRAKAIDLIDSYANTTTSYINSIFSPRNIQDIISQQSHTNIISAIPEDLQKYAGLFKSIHIEDLTFAVDYSSIYDVYDVTARIPKKPFMKKYRGGEIVDIMIGIEHKFFGLSSDQPVGFIPQQFFSSLKNKIEEWIGAVIRLYRDGYIAIIENERSKALQKVIPNMAGFSKESCQLADYIKGVEDILNRFNN